MKKISRHLVSVNSDYFLTNKFTTFEDLGTTEFKVWLTKNSALASAMIVSSILLVILLFIVL